ncbi:N-acyl-D-amino-acid deacylase family protein [Tamaricihabitans halophyticus]|nr:D-aminoacylase [Tamaricihabitans halophyticus]
MIADRFLLRGGEIIDGTGTLRRKADVLVEAGRIAQIGTITDSVDARIMDVAGAVLLPGFIDVHAHDDLALLRAGGVDPKVLQGVTVDVIGNCGHGCAPLGADRQLHESYSGPILGDFPETMPWRSFPEYLDVLASTPLRTNAVALVPHGALRAAIAGYARRALSAPEVDQAARLLTESMERGAAGLSLGLMYAPGDVAEQAELVALARAVAANDGILAAHIRSEGDDIVASLDELLDIARLTGVRTQLSHLKVVSPRNRGRMPEVLELLDAARAEGIDITADVYPYPAGSTTVSALFPNWTLADGVPGLLTELADSKRRATIIDELRQPWQHRENNLRSLGAERIRLAGFQQPENQRYEGWLLSDVAAERDADPIECLGELVLEEQGKITVVLFQMDEQDVATALSWPWSMIGSDGLPVRSPYTHPRMYGTFPRVLREYALDRGLFTVEEAVRRMTSLPADRFRIAGRGTITTGAPADLVAIDLARLDDRANFTAPRQTPAGIRAVLVNGAPAATEGITTDRYPGTLLPAEFS